METGNGVKLGDEWRILLRTGGYKGKRSKNLRRQHGDVKIPGKAPERREVEVIGGSGSVQHLVVISDGPQDVVWVSTE